MPIVNCTYDNDKCSAEKLMSELKTYYCKLVINFNLEPRKDLFIYHPMVRIAVSDFKIYLEL